MRCMLRCSPFRTMRCIPCFHIYLWYCLCSIIGVPKTLSFSVRNTSAIAKHVRVIPPSNPALKLSAGVYPAACVGGASRISTLVAFLPYFCFPVYLLCMLYNILLVIEGPRICSCKHTYTYLLSQAIVGLLRRGWRCASPSRCVPCLCCPFATRFAFCQRSAFVILSPPSASPGHRFMLSCLTHIFPLPSHTYLHRLLIKGLLIPLSLFVIKGGSPFSIEVSTARPVPVLSLSPEVDCGSTIVHFPLEHSWAFTNNGGAGRVRILSAGRLEHMPNCVHSVFFFFPSSLFLLCAPLFFPDSYDSYLSFIHNMLAIYLFS